MERLFEDIKTLIANENVFVSEHGYDELAEDDLLLEEVLLATKSAIVLETYPDYHKGPCLLLLQWDADGNPVHVVWGIPLGCVAPAVLVTAYRPEIKKWSSDFRSRKNR